MRKAIAGGGAPVPVGPRWGDPPRDPGYVRCSPDGRWVIAGLVPAGNTGFDIWMLPLGRPAGKPRPYLETTANEIAPSFSPSSDWLAYASDETHRFEVYVQSFPDAGHRYQVSVDGGTAPVWSRDGKELFFLTPGGKMMAAAVRKSGGNLEIETPRMLFDSHIAPASSEPQSFDVTKDGRFLIPVPRQTDRPPLTLVVNWQAGLKK
jgi:Tol biopolymer transport system component